MSDNEKMVSRLGGGSSGPASSGLPLSVDIEELYLSSDSASPPRQGRNNIGTVTHGLQ